MKICLMVSIANTNIGLINLIKTGSLELNRFDTLHVYKSINCQYSTYTILVNIATYIYICWYE